MKIELETKKYENKTELKNLHNLNKKPSNTQIDFVNICETLDEKNISQFLHDLKNQGSDLSLLFHDLSPGFCSIGNGGEIELLKRLFNEFPELYSIPANELMELICSWTTQPNIFDFISFAQETFINYPNLSDKEFDLLKRAIYMNLFVQELPNRCDIIKNLIQIFFIDHPIGNSKDNLIDLLNDFCLDTDLICFLKDSHPAWSQLNLDDFAPLVNLALQRASFYHKSEKPPLSQRKEAILFWFKEMDPFALSSLQLTHLLSALIELNHSGNPHQYGVSYPHYVFSREEQKELLDFYTSLPAYSQMTSAMVGHLLKASADHFDPWQSPYLFEQLKNHPQYETISRIAYRESLEKLFWVMKPVRQVSEEKQIFNQLIATTAREIALELLNHPNGSHLNLRDFLKLAKQCNDGAIFQQIAAHPLWNTLCLNDFKGLVVAIKDWDLTTVEIFTKHPQWNSLDNNILAFFMHELTHCWLNPAAVTAMQAIARHPNWDQWSLENLEYVARTLRRENSDTLLIAQILMSHPNWPLEAVLN